MTPSDHERGQLEALIARGDLTVVFQPIVDVQDGSIAAMEALSRPGLDSGFASPTHLFHVAEELGLLWELEAVSRNASFVAAAGWPAGRQLFLNSSPAVFADDRFITSICTLADQTPGLGRGRLVLEITELSEETHTDRLITRAEELKLAGFGVAVDDAGAGTSGLNRIMSIRPHWIKLDREFVRNIHTDVFRQNLVQFFTQFARLSNISVVAEGVETLEELATVVSLGVRYAQGYYLARPAALDAAGSPDLVAHVLERWQTVERNATTGGGWSTPSTAGVRRLATEVPILTTAQTASDAHEALAEQPSASGVIVSEGGRAVGWVALDRVESANSAELCGQSLGSMMVWPLLRVPPEATLQEALEVTCVLDDQAPTDPLLVAGAGRVLGVVSLRDLIRAATREGRIGAGHAGIAHLASRVQTDRHLADVIDAWKDQGAAVDRSVHADAAFIDIQRFSDCNTAFGYPFGDRLIRTLSEHIESEVAGPIHSCFLAHLGEDRFLLTAPTGDLHQRLKSLVDRFDRFAAQINDPAAPVASRPDVVARLNADRAPVVALRVVFMPNVLAEISHSRELYRREQIARQSLSHSGTGTRPSTAVESIFIVDDPDIGHTSRAISA